LAEFNVTAWMLENNIETDVGDINPLPKRSSGQHDCISRPDESLQILPFQFSRIIHHVALPTGSNSFATIIGSSTVE